MSATLNIGVVGLGNMGSAHLNFIKNIPSLKLAAVCDLKEELVNRLAKQHDTKAYTDAETMMASGEIQAVILAVPHYFHTTMAVRAFELGLHVLTEKPIAVHKADAERMIAAHSKRPDLKFAAMFNQRTDPCFIKLKKLIESGELGKIKRVSWIITTWFRSQAYYDSSDWRATWKGEGGGVLLNQCPHNIDLYQWFFGMPSKIRATCNIGKYHDIEVEDEVTAYMEYPDGMSSVFITSTGEAPGTNRLEITCDRGRLVLENGKMEFTRNLIPTQEFSDTTEQLFGIPEVWNVSIPLPPGNGGQHQAIIANFADAILNGADLIAPAEEGIKSVELANSMLYSSMNHTDVELPLDSAKYEAMLKELIRTSTFQKKVRNAAPVDFSKSFNAK